jgi:hypothetical protein
MSTLTVIGRVTDSIGAAEHRSYGWEGKAAVEYRRFEALPSVEYRTHHPAPLEVTLDHAGAAIGRALHLERSADDSIWAVAAVDYDDLLITRPGSLYWSPELRYRRDGTDIEVTGLSVTMNPATVGLTPLELYPGDAHQAASYVKARHRPALAAMLERAAEADRRRRFGDPLVVADPTAPTPAARPWYLDELDQLDHRTSGREEIHYSAPYNGVLGVR